MGQAFFFYVFSWLRESSKLILQETDFVLSHQVTWSEGLPSFEGEARNPIFARTDAVHDTLFRSSRGAHPLLTVGVLCTDLSHSRSRVGGIEMIKHVWKCRTYAGRIRFLISQFLRFFLIETSHTETSVIVLFGGLQR